MQTAHEFFLHELSDMLDAERRILEALEEVAGESSNPELEKAFSAHHTQTQEQIERLEQCFEKLGESAEETECAGIKGILEEHENFKEEGPAEDILDVFNISAASKVERYEITAYESLIRLADMMEHKSVSRLLKQNLKEEEQTLKKLQQLVSKVQPENLGMDEDEEDAEMEGAEAEETPQQRAPRHAPTKSRPRRVA